MDVVQAGLFFPRTALLTKTLVNSSANSWSSKKAVSSEAGVTCTGELITDAHTCSVGVAFVWMPNTVVNGDTSQKQKQNKKKL